ncbi:hypothetical protein LNI98_09540 [Tenacibaculum dicentrarchi]|nr:hypothetical protein [Tenacibaculum dicentrarchi]
MCSEVKNMPVSDVVRVDSVESISLTLSCLHALRSSLVDEIKLLESDNSKSDFIDVYDAKSRLRLVNSCIGGLDSLMFLI